MSPTPNHYLCCAPKQRLLRVDTSWLFYRERATGLNIKNEETCRLARELAQQTGETKTGAITVALRERLERERQRRGADILARELHAIG